MTARGSAGHLRHRAALAGAGAALSTAAAGASAGGANR
jgi:hypothetical protein